MKMNEKGFTLIELIASMVILAILMVITVPNVIGILAQQKKNTYKEDAGKLVSTAKYKFNANKKAMLDSQIPDKSGKQCIIMSLGYLDNSEFDKGPNGGVYHADESFVVIVGKAGEEAKDADGNTFTPKKFEYYVRLFEEPKASTSYGVELIEYSKVQKGEFNVIEDFEKIEGLMSSQTDADSSLSLAGDPDNPADILAEAYNLDSIGCEDVVNIFVQQAS